MSTFARVPTTAATGTPTTRTMGRKRTGTGAAMELSDVCAGSRRAPADGRLRRDVMGAPPTVTGPIDGREPRLAGHPAAAAVMLRLALGEAPLSFAACDWELVLDV